MTISISSSSTTSLRRRRAVSAQPRIIRRVPRPPTPPRPPAGITPLLRLVGLIALAILLIVLLVFWVQSCRGSSKQQLVRELHDQGLGRRLVLVCDRERPEQAPRQPGLTEQGAGVEAQRLRAAPAAAGRDLPGDQPARAAAGRAARRGRVDAVPRERPARARGRVPADEGLTSSDEAATLLAAQVQRLLDERHHLGRPLQDADDRRAEERRRDRRVRPGVQVPHLPDFASSGR